MYMGYELDYNLIKEFMESEKEVVIGCYRFNENSFIEIKHSFHINNQKIVLTYIVDGEEIISETYEFFFLYEIVEKFVEEIYHLLQLFIKHLIELKNSKKYSKYYHEYFRLMRFKNLFGKEKIYFEVREDGYFLSFIFSQSENERKIKNSFLDSKCKNIFTYSFLLNEDEDDFELLFFKSINCFFNKEKYIFQNTINLENDSYLHYIGTISLEKAKKNLKFILLNIIR